MITQDQLRTVVGATAYGSDGDKIGNVGQVYYDDATGQPTWVTVSTGLFGTQESFVPVSGAELSGDRVTLAYDKATVKDAPKIAGDGHLSAPKTGSRAVPSRLPRHQPKCDEKPLAITPCRQA